MAEILEYLHQHNPSVAEHYGSNSGDTILNFSELGIVFPELFNGERRPEGGHALAERVGYVELARDGAHGVAVVEGAKGQRRPLLRVGDLAGNVHVNVRLDGRARVIVGRLRAPLELHGVDPEDAPVALRGLEVKPDGDEQERLRRRERVFKSPGPLNEIRG